MNIILTQYIYPIKEPIILSKSLGIVIDNPRTENEIAIICQYLKFSLDSPSKMYVHDHQNRIPMYTHDKHIITIKGAFNNLKTTYLKKDSYLKDFYKKNSTRNGYEFLAKMWIIARFNDGGELEKLQKHHSELIEKGEKGWFTILDSDNPIMKNSQRLVDYSFLFNITN
jgi:hypothetical protein